MGLIFDSSVFVAAERQGKNARHVLMAVAQEVGETEVGISVVRLIELAHGVARADTPDRKSRRKQFLEELQMAMPVHPVNALMALRAGEVNGQNQARGVKVPLADLLTAC